MSSRLLSSLARINGHTTRPITSAARAGGQFGTDLAAYKSVSHGVTPLNSYGLIKVSGKDSLTFLQGLVTNDLTNTDNPSTYNAILAANGRYLYDCFISQWNDDYFIETDNDSIVHIIKYFKKYKLRSKVKFEDVSDEYRVWSVLTPPKSVNATYERMAQKYVDQRLCYIDPRYSALGIRIILNKNEIPHHLSDDFVPIGEDFYNALKCIYGIPSHGSDLIGEKTIILEANFNYLNGVSFNKGCYVGQELIARTHHRGQIRKRLFGASIVEKTENMDCSVKALVDNDDAQNTIIPTEMINVQNINFDFKNRNIVDMENQKVVGKITSKESSLNVCIAQLRNSAFVGQGNGDAKTVGLQIQDSDFCVIPHCMDYFNSFSELFAAKE